MTASKGKKRRDELIGEMAALPQSARLSEDAQWHEVRLWLDCLQSSDVADFPILDSLNAQWECVRGETGMSDEEYGRGRDLRRTSDSPLAALFYFIEMGFYPPPELLLGLADSWGRYKQSGGAISLEEAFLGPPRRGAGNYSARSKSRFRRIWMQWEFQGMLRDGMSRSEAAEEISRRLGGKPDADSILRGMRGFSGPTVKTSDAPEK